MGDCDLNLWEASPVESSLTAQILGYLAKSSGQLLCPSWPWCDPPVEWCIPKTPVKEAVLRSVLREGC